MTQTLLKKEEKKPWEDTPLEIIIEDKKRREIERWDKKPRVYDYVIIPYHKPEEKKKKEPERGVAIIKFY